jgi:hypothetical protein
MHNPTKRKAVTAIPPMPFEMYLRARACKRLGGWMFKGKCATPSVKCRLRASPAYQALELEVSERLARLSMERAPAHGRTEKRR